MISRKARPPTFVSGKRAIRIIALVVLTALFVMVSSIAGAAEAPIGLGGAGSFAVLSGESITNSGATTINGDVGLFPGTSVTGFDTVTLNGALHQTDVVAEEAKASLASAYGNAAGRGPATTVATELGGQTLIGGVYSSGSGTFGITGTLTLDAAGDPDSVFIFQMASTLITASGSSVSLINGAQACNVYWQVGSSATLGTSTSFRGTILAMTSITLNTGATIVGRALARNGSVTMDGNTITRVGCAAPETTTTTTTVAATTTTVAATTTTVAATTTTVAATTTTTVASTTTTVAAPVTTTTSAAGTTTTTSTAATTTTVGDFPISRFVAVTTTLPPVGFAATGGGSTAVDPNMTLLILGGALLIGAAGVFALRLRIIRQNSAN